MTHRNPQRPTYRRAPGHSIRIALIAALAWPLGLMAQDGLSVFISADMEGVVGAVTSELLGYLPSVDRLDSHTIGFTGRDMLEDSRILEFITSYSPSLTP